MERLKEVVESVKKNIEEEGTKYFEDVLDIQATIDTRGNITEVTALVAFGGPTVLVRCDGATITIEGSWGSDKYSEVIRDSNLAKEVFEHLVDLFEGITVRRP